MAKERDGKRMRDKAARFHGSKSGNPIRLPLFNLRTRLEREGEATK